MLNSLLAVTHLHNQRLKIDLRFQYEARPRRLIKAKTSKLRRSDINSLLLQQRNSKPVRPPVRRRPNLKNIRNVGRNTFSQEILRP